MEIWNFFFCLQPYFHFLHIIFIKWWLFGFCFSILKMSLNGLNHLFLSSSHVSWILAVFSLPTRGFSGNHELLCERWIFHSFICIWIFWINFNFRIKGSIDSQGFNLSEFIFSVTQFQPIYICACSCLLIFIFLNVYFIYASLNLLISFFFFFLQMRDKTVYEGLGKNEEVLWQYLSHDKNDPCNIWK